MFSKISRYRKLSDVITTDTAGRALTSREVRPIPEVTGAFLHTIEETDRLDHLSYKFYKQPRKWWRIVDANPQFPSPQALLGKEPFVTYRFPVTVPAAPAGLPWAGLLDILRNRIGVEDATLEEEPVLYEIDIPHEGAMKTITMEKLDATIVVTFNRLIESDSDLVDCIEKSGFEVGGPVNIGRIGKRINIPQDAST
jgi:hypothetical protein